MSKFVLLFALMIRGVKVTIGTSILHPIESFYMHQFTWLFQTRVRNVVKIYSRIHGLVVACENYDNNPYSIVSMRC